MSDETARALAAAEADESQQQAVVDRLKQQVLDSVAKHMPDHIDAYAKNSRRNSLPPQKPSAPTVSPPFVKSWPKRHRSLGQC